MITVGIVILAYSGITFTTPGETLQFLGLRVQTTNMALHDPLYQVIAVGIAAGALIGFLLATRCPCRGEYVVSSLPPV